LFDVGSSNPIRIPDTAMQADFAMALLHLRKTMLQEALGEAVESLDLVQVDRELALLAPAEPLKVLAG